MTIIAKWRLMMSSFEDIKAAIIEKGGALTDDKGYNRYANAVRSIYSDTYTDEYEYPAKVFPAISNAISLVRWCKTIKEQIRAAINDGGVECDSSIPLRAYGDKIRELGVELQIVSPQQLPDGNYRKPYEYQLQATGGTPPYTWDADSFFGCLGLTVSADGHVSGTITQNGGYTIFSPPIKVTDAKGNTATKSVKLYARPATVWVWFQRYVKYTGEPITPQHIKLEADVDISDFEYEIYLDGELTQTEVGCYNVRIQKLPRFYSSQWNAKSRPTMYIVTPEEYEEKGYGDKDKWYI